MDCHAKRWWNRRGEHCRSEEMAYSLVSIILPVYNQADHIAEVLEEYESALVNVPTPHEYLLVVNACRDDSLEVSKGLADRYESVRVIHSEKGGWGHAVLLGLAAAQGDLLCYTNLARTHAKDLTLVILYATVFSSVVVKANRKIRDNWHRRLGSLLYNLECRALFDLSYWDINGTPKVFPRSFDKLLSLTRKDDLIDVEFSACCRREGYPVLEVPIFSSLRHGGASTTSYLSAIKMYWGAIRLWRKMRVDDR
jgi:glycosyltransferase involved in cell wall biosynthesis